MRAPWLVLLLPAACAAPPPAPPPAAAQPLAPAFDAPQAAEALRGGHNTIHGDAFLFLAQGARQTCAGEVASLIPATNYAEWRMQAIYGDRPALPISDASPHDPTLERYVVHTRCDPTGHFTFRRLADGDWFVTVRIGGWSLHRQVHLSGGQALTVRLTN